jgi:hypothetical protein
MSTPFRKQIKTRRTLALLPALVLAFACAGAADITWTNTAGGNWNAAANWSPNQVPGTNDHALITADGTYVVTVNAATTVNRLTLGAASGTQTLTNNSSGSLRLAGEGLVLANGVLSRGSSTFTCTGSLTVHGQVIWTGGDWVGAGSTTFSPSARVLFGGNNSTKDLSGGQAWFNSGRIVFTNITGTSGFLFARGNSVISNLAEGVIEVATDREALRADTGSRGIINHGTLRRATTTGTAIIGLLENHGLVEVQAGVLRAGGSVTNTGEYRIAAGTTLEVEDAPVLAQSARVVGEGNFSRIGSGTVARIEGTFDVGGTNNLGAASLNFTTNSTVPRIGRVVRLNGSSATLTANSGERHRIESLLVLNGTITGSDSIEVSGSMIWDNGNLSGAGEILARGGLFMTNNAFGLIYDLGSDRVLRNAGPARWSGGIIRFIGTQTAIENLAGGVFEIATDNDAQGERVRNFGVMRKTAGTGVCELGLTRNEGTVEILSGSLGVANNFVQTAAGKLVVRIAGAAPNTELSQLVFPDLLAGQTRPQLDGCLGVVLAGGFVPELGQAFPIVPHPRTPDGKRPAPGGRFVCFDNMTIFGAARRYQLAQGTNSVDLTVVPNPEESPLIYYSTRAGQLRLCWGEEFPGYRLENREALDGSPWANLPLPGVPDQDVTVLLSEKPQRYFRLTKP